MNQNQRGQLPSLASLLPLLAYPDIFLAKASLVVVDADVVSVEEELEGGFDAFLVGVVVGVLDEFEDEVSLLGVEILGEARKTAAEARLRQTIMYIVIESCISMIINIVITDDYRDCIVIISIINIVIVLTIAASFVFPLATLAFCCCRKRYCQNAELASVITSQFYEDVSVSVSVCPSYFCFAFIMRV